MIPVKQLARNSGNIYGKQLWLDPNNSTVCVDDAQRTPVSAGWKEVEFSNPRQWQRHRFLVQEVEEPIEVGTLRDAPETPAPGQAFKADAGKPMFDLLEDGCPNAILGVVKVLTFAVTPVDAGGKGYVPHSWKDVPDAKRRYSAAIRRHQNAIARGETHDSESKLPHSWHIATNAIFLAELEYIEGAEV